VVWAAAVLAHINAITEIAAAAAERPPKLLDSPAWKIEPPAIKPLLRFDIIRIPRFFGGPRNFGTLTKVNPSIRAAL